MFGRLLGNNMKKREIKFRAWDKTYKRMNYKVLVGNTDSADKNYTCNAIWVDYAGEYMDTWKNADEHCIELMQYTGQQDNEGVDIYEGDILEFDESEWRGKDNIHVVSWDNNEACWCFGGSSVQSDKPFRKKIGNIYENPELLKFPAMDNTYYKPF